MHDSTLDLFIEHEMSKKDLGDRMLEEVASKYEVTVDYLLEEFVIDDESIRDLISEAL